MPLLWKLYQRSLHGELLQVQVSPVKQLGSYHMPIAQNPVYIAVMQHPVKDDVEEIEWLDS